VGWDKNSLTEEQTEENDDTNTGKKTIHHTTVGAKKDYRGSA